MSYREVKTYQLSCDWCNRPGPLVTTVDGFAPHWLPNEWSYREALHDGGHYPYTTSQTLCPGCTEKNKARLAEAKTE